MFNVISGLFRELLPPVCYNGVFINESGIWSCWFVIRPAWRSARFSRGLWKVGLLAQAQNALLSQVGRVKESEQKDRDIERTQQALKDGVNVEVLISSYLLGLKSGLHLVIIIFLGRFQYCYGRIGCRQQLLVIIEKMMHRFQSKVPFDHWIRCQHRRKRADCTSSNHNMKLRNSKFVNY